MNHEIFGCQPFTRAVCCAQPSPLVNRCCSSLQRLHRSAVRGEGQGCNFQQTFSPVPLEGRHFPAFFSTEIYGTLCDSHEYSTCIGI